MARHKGQTELELSAVAAAPRFENKEQDKNWELMLASVGVCHFFICICRYSGLSMHKLPSDLTSAVLP